MSHFMTALAMKQKGLKPATKIVLYWLADHHNETTKECFPRISRLAELCDMSRRSVEGHLTILEEFGLIKRINRFRDQGGKTSNGYILYLSESDAQNLRIPSEKSAHGDTQNLRMNNLINNNLVNEPNILIERFDEFYAAYPIKKGKGAAKKAWEKAIKKADPDHIISNAALYASSVQNKDPKFIAHPATWLNAERWDDDISKELLQASIDPQNMMLDVLKSMGLKYNA